MKHTPHGLDLPVAVLPDRQEPGIDKHADLESGRARTYRARPLSDVISTHYSTYAHLLLYHVPGETKWPRINKPALEECRELGLDPQVSLTALDLDNPEHKPWEDKQGYLKLLKKIQRKAKSGLQLPTFVWRTRAGARLLFVHPPVKPEQAEALHDHLRTHYASFGIIADPKVWEWARPHALPWVTRDEVALDPEPVLQFTPMTALPDLPERKVNLRLNSDTLRANMPDPAECMALVWKQGTDKLTEWGAWAKKRTQGSDMEVCYDPNTVPTLEHGMRNPTLFRWAGALCKSFFNRKGSTAEHVFGVLCPTIEANLTEGRDLHHEVWRGICYCWSREEAQGVHDAKERRGFMEVLRSGMAEWCPDTPESEEEFSQWVRTRLVLAHGGDYYVLRPDGRYTPYATKHGNLVASLRTSGLVGPGAALPDLTSKEGTAIKCQDVVDRFSTPVSTASVTGGASIGGIYVDTPFGPRLDLTTFARRADISAEPGRRAAAWLRAMWGEHLPTAEEWISCALNFEGGACAALSVVAGAGVGKDLFFWALVNTITTRTFSTAKQVVGEFKPKLHLTPWVWFNEGCPTTKDLHMNFRELVGGHVLESNRKHMQQVDVKVCARVYMSANKPVVVQRLFGDPNMTETEQEATAERVIHVNLGNGGRRWFEENGGKDTARDMLESDELTKHFLWLWETIPRSRHSGRFQICGDRHDPFLRSLGFAALAAVGETLVRMIETGRLTNCDKLRAGKVLDFSDNLLLTSRMREFNVVTLGRALVPFTRRDRTPDMLKIWEFAKSSGMEAPVLRRLVGKLKKVPT